MALALVLSLLVAGLGSQTFYPREGSVGMWCAIGLLLRVDRERVARARSASAPSRPPSVPGASEAACAGLGGAAPPAAATRRPRRMLWARAS